MAGKHMIVDSFISLAKKIRTQQGLTIEQLADAAGVHRTTIGLLERGERTPTLQVAQQIAGALGYKLSEMLKSAELTDPKDVHSPEDSHPAGRPAFLFRKNRKPLLRHVRNEEKLISATGIDSPVLLDSIHSCYQTLDAIDDQLAERGSVPIANLVEKANLSSMIGNIIGGAIAANSGGLYQRNHPHSYPDLVPCKEPAVDLELKVALETNKPKGHHPKDGTYITFRYVLADKNGRYRKGRQCRGDTVWIWEVKAGRLATEDFSCSSTTGDSGKTAMIKPKRLNEMPLIYYVPELLPYARKSDGSYIGFN